MFASRTRAEWEPCLADVETCFAPVLSLEEATADPQAQALGFFADDGQVSLRRRSLCLGRRRACGGRRRRLGEHTRELLAELGLDDAEMRQLAANGVI